MRLGAMVPLGDIGGDADTVRDYAQGLEDAGYDFMETPDHVLGVNVASRPDWEADRNTSQDLHHDPFVLLSYAAAVAPKLGFSTGVLIVPQRQTVLVAKQAACLDVLCKGRFRLGIGVGWNEVDVLNGLSHIDTVDRKRPIGRNRIRFDLADILNFRGQCKLNGF